MFDLVSKVKVVIEVTQLPCMKNSSLCQLKLNRYTQCIEQCDEVLEIEPDCTKTLYRKATAKLALGQLDEAETIFRRCFYLDPQ
jgi:tetratricopeptide (TPR) repeat protein